VDFVLTEDQSALQAATRKQLAGQFPMAEVRALEAVGGVDRHRWTALGEAGVFSLRADEAAGGVGMGMAESVLVFEELGRALVPGPLVGSHLAASVAEGAGTGSAVVGVVDRGDRFVEHFAALDHLVVLDSDGVWLLGRGELAAASASPVTSLDPLTPIHRVTNMARGRPVGGRHDADRWRVEGAVLTAAMQLGIAEAVTDAGVAYAKQRVQFDKPIGAFQAVKHLLADMLVRVEMARAAVYAAGVTIDDPEVGDAARAAAGAKILAGEAALSNAKSNVQVHGGMGFTWEVDAHLYLKRAWVLDTVFGSSDAHAEALAATIS
jgi:alkylation response protein AidB-like acyl-CoA dehydrogenase